MDDRDRAAPIALARNAPIAQLVVDLGPRLRPVAERLRLQPPRDLVTRGLDRHPVEEARIDHRSVAVIGDFVDDETRGIDARRADHRRRAEAVDVDEIEVALVVRGAAEDRARAVIHQDEIGDIDRQRPVRVERMRDPQAGVVALLFRRLDRGDRGADAPAFLDEGGKLRVMRGGGRRERVIRGDRHKFGAEQSIGPRRVDFQFGRRALPRQRPQRTGFDGEADQQAFRAPDPVALHEAHFVGPAIEPVERAQQFLGIVGDLEEPLRQFALLDDRAGPPAAPVHHLLVGEHGMVDRVPVHLGFLARDQSRPEEIQEQLLLMLVVSGIAGRDLARPVERQTHGFELRAHRVDVGIGPARRMRLVLHRSVFGGHAESVPAHRMQHVVAPRAPEPRHYVAHRVIADMAHVNAAGGVGKHFEHVIFRPRIEIARLEHRAIRPDGLPFPLGFADVVALGPHGRKVSDFVRFGDGLASKHDLGAGSNGGGKPGLCRHREVRSDLWGQTNAPSLRSGCVTPWIVFRRHGKIKETFAVIASVSRSNPR